MTFSSKKPYLIPGIIILFILILILLNILVKPYLTIKTFSDVLPKEKWMLTRGTNGQIISSVINYEIGHTVEYSLNQFERGEFVNLEFMFEKNKEKFVSKGDTVINIYSSDVLERIIDAQGEYNTAIANLRSQSTGQKEAIVNEAIKRLKYTEEQIAEQKIWLGRLETLREKNLASQQEYETQKWAVDLLEIEKGIYEEQIRNLSTGAKPEDIELFKSQLNTSEMRMKFLNQRKKYLTITSPISGYVSNIYSPDTLVTLINDQQIILNAAVKTSDLDEIKTGRIIKLTVGNSDKEYSGLVLSISREVKFLSSEQVSFVSIRLNNKDGRLKSGMVKESYLQIKRISFLEYLFKLISA